MEANVIVVTFDGKRPEKRHHQQIIPAALAFVRDHFPSASAAIDSFVRTTSCIPFESAIFRTPAEDPEDFAGKYARTKNPGMSIYNIGPIHADDLSYRCLVLVRPQKAPEYHRSDHADPGDSLLPKATVSRNTAPTLSRNADIREILACDGFSRVATLVCASPGTSETGHPSRPSVAIDRNEGSLLATKNDFNALFGMLRSLRGNHTLPGLTAVGLVMSKQVFLSLVWLATQDDAGVQTYAYGDNDLGFTGAILWNTKISGVIVRSGVVMGGEIGVGSNEKISITDSVVMGTTFRENQSPLHRRIYIKEAVVIQADMEEELFQCPPDDLYLWDSTGSEAARKGCAYALVYYAGHGSEDGCLQIQPDETITAEEMFTLSKESELPFVIILDMCYSHAFGARYERALHKADWRGLVLCANDGSASYGKSYEAPKMSMVRRPLATVGVLESNFELGRGVYTTALTLAMMKLRDWDLRSEKKTTMTVQEFNESMLIPICGWLSDTFGVPVQRPVVFGS